VRKSFVIFIAIVGFFIDFSVGAHYNGPIWWSEEEAGRVSGKSK